MRTDEMRAVEIREVGPRDGLQSLGRTLPPGDRLELIAGLVGAGLRRVEVGSFVSPKAVPQMARTAEVLAALPPEPGVAYETLVLNDRGIDLALGAGSTHLVTVVAASDTFSRRNAGMARSAALDVARRALRRATSAGADCVADVATAFGCAYEGPVAREAVVDTALELADAGYREITLADTIGTAAPTDVTDVVEAVRDRLGPGVTIGLHFHDTRGMGLANVLAGLGIGVRLFDASVGGIGGCPFSPGATGNVCTEDLVHMLDAMGHPSGIDLRRLLGVARDAQTTLGSTLPGQLLRAGPRFDSPSLAAQ
jgi:hydroxymethylglutaryl-CoA lyase